MLLRLSSHYSSKVQPFTSLRPLPLDSTNFSVLWSISSHATPFASSFSSLPTATTLYPNLISAFPTHLLTRSSVFGVDNLSKNHQRFSTNNVEKPPNSPPTDDHASKVDQQPEPAASSASQEASASSASQEPAASSASQEASEKAASGSQKEDGSKEQESSPTVVDPNAKEEDFRPSTDQATGHRKPPSRVLEYIFFALTLGCLGYLAYNYYESEYLPKVIEKEVHKMEAELERINSEIEILRSERKQRAQE